MSDIRTIISKCEKSFDLKSQRSERMYFDEDTGFYYSMILRYQGIDDLCESVVQLQDEGYYATHLVSLGRLYPDFSDRYCIIIKAQKESFHKVYLYQYTGENREYRHVENRIIFDEKEMTQDQIKALDFAEMILIKGERIGEPYYKEVRRSFDCFIRRNKELSAVKDDGKKAKDHPDAVKEEVNRVLNRNVGKIVIFGASRMGGGKTPRYSVPYLIADEYAGYLVCLPCLNEADHSGEHIAKDIRGEKELIRVIRKTEMSVSLNMEILPSDAVSRTVKISDRTMIENILNEYKEWLRALSVNAVKQKSECDKLLERQRKLTLSQGEVWWIYGDEFGPWIDDIKDKKPRPVLINYVEGDIVHCYECTSKGDPDAKKCIEDSKSAGLDDSRMSYVNKGDRKISIRRLNNYAGRLSDKDLLNIFN